MTEGDTREAGLANARDAIALMIEDLQADGERVPQGGERPQLVEIEIEIRDPVVTPTA